MFSRSAEFGKRGSCEDDEWFSINEVRSPRFTRTFRNNSVKGIKEPTYTLGLFFTDRLTKEHQTQQPS